MQLFEGHSMIMRDFKFINNNLYIFVDTFESQIFPTIIKMDTNEYSV